jgi:protein-tyrosine phosphatase
VSPFREPPKLRFERIANFRDLAGHTTRDGRRVRAGRLFRSGHLAHASDSDVASLSRLGLRHIFDLRTLKDIGLEGEDRVPEGADYVRLPMPDPARAQDIRAILQESGADGMEEIFGGGRAAEMMRDAAAGMVSDRIEPFAEFLRLLANPESGPALFHCSAGKDRAGWAGSIALLALGVEEEQVVEQYLLSNREIESIRERISTEETIPWADLLSPLLEVRAEYIEASFSAMHEDWGTFDRYLTEGLSISDPQLAQLRESLLE